MKHLHRIAIALAGLNLSACASQQVIPESELAVPSVSTSATLPQNTSILIPNSILEPPKLSIERIPQPVLLPPLETQRPITENIDLGNYDAYQSQAAHDFFSIATPVQSIAIASPETNVTISTPPIDIGRNSLSNAIHLGHYNDGYDSYQTQEVQMSSQTLAPSKALPTQITFTSELSHSIQPSLPQTSFLGGMSPIYEEGDFAPPPENPNTQSGELSAPLPRRGGAIKQNHFNPNIARNVAQTALRRTHQKVRYDGQYIPLSYPWGDVPDNIGVCTDVIVRAYRGAGIDLQKLVHEDISRAFNDYPSREIYGKTRPDRNIDHRRVVNLERFLERMGAALPLRYQPDAYMPGDIISWRINGTQPHIGVVIEKRDPKTGYPMVVHNIGSGPKADNILALQEPVGHYRYTPSNMRVAQR